LRHRRQRRLAALGRLLQHVLLLLHRCLERRNLLHQGVIVLL
jgi:hypothetical protein